MYLVREAQNAKTPRSELRGHGKATVGLGRAESLRGQALAYRYIAALGERQHEIVRQLHEDGHALLHRKVFFWTVPMANAEGWDGPEASIGKVVMRCIFRYLRIGPGWRHSPLACSEMIGEKGPRLQPGRGLPWRYFSEPTIRSNIRRSTRFNI